MKTRANRHFLYCWTDSVVFDFDALRYLLCHFAPCHLPFSTTRTKTDKCMLYGNGLWRPQIKQKTSVTISVGNVAFMEKKPVTTFRPFLALATPGL